MQNKAAEFCTVIHQYIDYWEKQSEKTKKERLNGLAFSILRILDGLSPKYDGDIHSLVEMAPTSLLHDMFRQTKKIET